MVYGAIALLPSHGPIKDWIAIPHRAGDYMGANGNLRLLLPRGGWCKLGA